MAKRAAPDEQPFRPLLDTSLVSEMLGDNSADIPPPSVPQRGGATASKIVEMPIADIPQRERSFSERQANLPAKPTVRVSETTLSYIQDSALKEIEKRILFSRLEVQLLDRMVASLALRLQCQVKFSHVVRSLIALLMHAEAHVDQRAGESAPLIRPANGDPQGIQDFENEIAKIIASALRDAGPIR